MDSVDYQEIRKLFHELADLPLREARALLEEREMSDTVRTGIERLLDQDPNEVGIAEDPNEGLAMRLLESEGVKEVPAEEASPLPDSIAGFRIVEVLGRGGMGIVYRAVQERPKREVAIKVLQYTAATEESLRRFEYEAEVLARLDHPYVANVIQAGVDAALGGLPYIVMELVDGLELITYADDHGLDRVQRLELFRRVCEGVEHAHQHAIVHRDLKPANVLVGLDGRPRILDFGIARPAASDDCSTPGRTVEGSVVGSLAWMSPEQAGGEIENIDTRSDVYSLGAVLYRLLSGRMPHEIEGLVPWEAARRICEEEPARLGAEDASLRGDLEAICAKALEHDPGRRYSGAGALGRDVGRFLEHAPVEARPWSATYQLAKFARRHRLLAGSLFLLVASVVIGLVTSLLLLEQAREARILADTEAGHARESEALAEAERQNVLRLADLREYQAIEADANELWPIHPDRAEAMQAWVDRAERLIERTNGHREFLASLSEQADERLPLTETERAWWIEQLTLLTDSLDGLAAEGGLLEDVRTRLDHSLTLERRSVIDYADRWGAAIEYAADPNGPYKGLDLKPQIGLVPFPTPNTWTGLLEFWHVETGVEPERDEKSQAFTMFGESAMVLALLPGGEFTMGTQSDFPDGPNYDPDSQADEHPPHIVVLSPFFMARHEVTQGVWTRLAGSNPSVYHMDNNLDGWWPRAHPVDTVSWYDATDALARIGLVLPTEAQWEYAARAGATTPYACGANPGCLSGTANIGDQMLEIHGAPDGWHISPWNDSFYGPAPSGFLRDNKFGMHEIQANLREWVRDRYSEDDPYGPRDGIVDPLVDELTAPWTAYGVRGGDFASKPSFARTGARSGQSPGSATAFIGVRAARPLER